MHYSTSVKPAGGNTLLNPIQNSWARAWIVFLLYASFFLGGPTFAASSTLAEKPSTISHCLNGYHQMAGAYHKIRGRTPEEISEREQDRREVWKNRYEATAKYLQEVRNSWGLRLAFHSPPKEEPIASGFWTPYNPQITKWYHHFELIKPTFYLQLPFRVVSKLATKQTYSLTPFEGTFHTLLQKPVRMLSHRLWGKTFQLTLPLKIIAGMYAASPLFDLYDQATYAAMENALEGSLEENHEEYDEMIEYDLRFSEIRKDLQRGYLEDPQTEERTPFTQKDARDAALKLFQMLNAHTQYLATTDKKVSPSERRANLKFYFTFIAPTMKAILDRGKKDIGPEFIFSGKEGPFTPAEEDRLIEIQNEVLLKYRLLRAYVYDYKNELAEIRKIPVVNNRLNKILKSGYVQFLIDKQKEGVISRPELFTLLQSFIDWEARLNKINPVLGVTSLIQTDQGIRPRTLLDVQESTVKQIAERENQKPSLTLRPR